MVGMCVVVCGGGVPVEYLGRRREVGGGGSRGGEVGGGGRFK